MASMMGIKFGLLCRREESFVEFRPPLPRTLTVSPAENNATIIVPSDGLHYGTE